MSEKKLAPLNTDMDAQRWAKDFMERFGSWLSGTLIDESLMHSWFANAIMCGWDNAHWKNEAALTALRAELEQVKAERDRYREALTKISEAKIFTRLANCCAGGTCHIHEESGSCSFQTGVYYANGDRAAEADEALSAAAPEAAREGGE
jgi:hypothetical protein